MRGSNWVIGFGLLAVAGGLGGLLYLRAGPPPAPQPIAAAPPDAGEAPETPAADAGVAEVAQVDADALLRRLSSGGSKQLGRWLEAPGVLQRIAAAVRLIADGRSPRPVLAFIEMDENFQVIEEGDRLFVSPKSYTRYDRIVRAVTSIEPAELAAAYEKLRPHFEAAFSQVARPGERFDDVLARAIGRIVAVDVPKGRVELVPRGAIYLFADETLESLPAAEKHVLRMGPANAEAIQNMLRRFASGARLEI